MQPLAWLVTWQSLGKTRSAPFLLEVTAEAWRERQHGTKRPLVACGPLGAPVAWLVRFGDCLQHQTVTLDGEDAHRYASRMHGQRFPLALG